MYGDTKIFDPPTYEDLEVALNKLNNNKALGEDGIPGELLKHGGDEFLSSLQYNPLGIDRRENAKTVEESHHLSTQERQHTGMLQLPQYNILQCAYKIRSNAIYKKYL